MYAIESNLALQTRPLCYNAFDIKVFPKSMLYLKWRCVFEICMWNCPKSQTRVSKGQ